MSDRPDRPDGTYAVHIHQSAPEPDPVTEQSEPAAPPRIGQASQSIPVRPHQPAPGDSAAFAPLEIPLPPPLPPAEPLEVDLELAPPGAELPPAPSYYHPPGRELEATSLLRASPGAAGDLELDDRPALPSPHERSAGHADKQTPFKYTPMPPREPWWKRNIVSLVLGAILLVVASYIYGCTAVMGDTIDFRQNMADDMRTEFNNLNANWVVVTPEQVRASAQKVANKHGLDAVKVDIIAEPLGNVRSAGTTCDLANEPAALEYLGVHERTYLANARFDCTLPDHLLTLRVFVEGRWGLFHHEFDQVARVLVNKYSAVDD